MDKILLTGGSGLLGKELRKGLSCTAPSHSEFDITKPEKKYDCDLVIHAAAYTDVDKAEIEKKECFRINVLGTFNMVKDYQDIPFVYISTEWAFDPVNEYALSKAVGEEIVESFCHKYLIIRTLFKPNPYPWKYAFKDQYTKGDYVDVIAGKIIEKIFWWDKKTCQKIHVGTYRKTIYDLAKRTKPDVLPNSVDDIKGAKRPRDYK